MIRGRVGIAAWKSAADTVPEPTSLWCSRHVGNYTRRAKLNGSTGKKVTIGTIISRKDALLLRYDGHSRRRCLIPIRKGKSRCKQTPRWDVMKLPNELNILKGNKATGSRLRCFHERYKLQHSFLNDVIWGEFLRFHYLCLAARRS